eukprot:2132514-Ditylum_brightwellii.AAC.1
MECSEGDLDGDLYYVLWDKELIPPCQVEVPLLPYNEFVHTNDREDQTRYDDGDTTGFGGGIFVREMMCGMVAVNSE